jgi:DNA polymerase-3 subunit epsilon
VAVIGPALALGLWLALGLVGLRAALDPRSRSAVDAALGPLVESHGMLVVLWWAVGAGFAAWAGARLHAAWAGAAGRMTDATAAMIGAQSAPDIIPEGAPPMRSLAAAINGLAQQRRALSATMAEQIEEASARVSQQRDQLAALMAELQQSVVVCNLEGRILLYNDRALALSRAMSRAAGGLGGAELVGLGRSIHGLIDPGPIAHALETVERRLARGETAVSTRFVTATPEGRLLRAVMAPVLSADALGGYVLLLDDITAEQQTQAGRDRLLVELIEASRASFAAMQAALDMLDYPDMEPADRERFQAVVRDEVTTMARRLERLAGEAVQVGAGWPLHEMQGADLLAAAARRIEADTGRPCAIEAPDPGMWLSVDSFSLIEALAFLAARLAGATAAGGLRLRLAPTDGRAHLDLAWEGDGPAAAALRRWQIEPFAAGTALTVREVVERHGGELWIEQDRAGGQPFFRFLLTLAEAAEAPPARASRPEYYDFDLFAASEGTRELDDRLLTELVCTVFDTETTGLDPVGGDEIIQIGAMRILNGRLLAGETFVQLVDPRRTISEASIPIHGIRQEMLRGQPTIAEVLPAFHAFARDTVLVGHNVAFDLRFFALKEAATGVRFDQPVLDTLLLASLAYPNETTHGLDTIAARLGVPVFDRHTALGDARTTAEVFLQLIPLLRRRRIATLGEARMASRKSYYAGLRY